MNTRRFISLSIIIIAIATFTCGQSEKMELGVGQQYLTPGDTTTITLRYTGSNHIAYQGRIPLDPAIHIGNIRSVNSDLSVMANEVNGGLNWGAYGVVSTSGDILAFEVSSDQTLDYTFTQEYALGNADSLLHGGAPIFWREQGDVADNDGINLDDVLTILRYVIFQQPTKPYIEVYGDMDGNGHIQVYDAAIILGQL